MQFDLCFKHSIEGQHLFSPWKIVLSLSISFNNLNINIIFDFQSFVISMFLIKIHWSQNKYLNNYQMESLKILLRKQISDKNNKFESLGRY